MRKLPFAPTDEQKAVIAHSGSAFISACPGAGKTQVLVERARQQLKITSTGRGLAFLSFTNAAISELKSRLQSEALLLAPPFPHYVGTFDTFLWQFFIAPLGIPGCVRTPQLIPDLDDRDVVPFNNAQPIPLSCFDHLTGKIVPDKAKQVGFDATAKPALTAKYEASAQGCRTRFLARGELGFRDVRALVKSHLSNKPLSTRLSAALAARFREIVVDEAQDCNPADIEIVNWLRAAGIVTKVICDPHQSIYEFRGGVTDELFALRDSFGPNDRLTMSDNFRSNCNICKAIGALRPPGEQDVTDQALGPAANDLTPVHVVMYPGSSIPPSIGTTFETLVRGARLEPGQCPVLSSTRDAACKATGQACDSATRHRSLRLAFSVSDFHAGVEINARKLALESVHGIVLELGGKIGEKTYHQFVAAEGLRPEDWRPLILELLQSLRYDPGAHATADIWLDHARGVLSPFLAANIGSIAQNLTNHKDLSSVLATKPASGLSPRTIHSVKGMEFPGVCVVLSIKTTKDIIDYLTSGQPSQSAEGARKLYVAASRAERLLVFAVPKSQGTRLIAHLKKTGAQVEQTMLTL
jgi:DNA helicase II / ATP-dependent DNA helicase PcrA